MNSMLRAFAAVIAAGCTFGAVAAETPPSPWRDRVFYPGLYVTAGYARDARDSVFDGEGNRSGTATPVLGGSTEFPETREEVQFSWYFPLFEAKQLPFISSHLYTSRIRIGQQQTRTEGALESFIATNPDVLPVTRGGSGGFEDITFEFGSFLIGGRNWRNQMEDNLSVLLLGGFKLPVGKYNRQAPISSGDNALAWHVRLGTHWQPWTGGALDGGIGYRWYASNPEPAFGRNAPAQQGTDQMFDLSFTQKLVPRLHLTGFASQRRGAANEYKNLVYAPNAAPAPPVIPAGTSRSYPTPGTYLDNGTKIFSVGASLHYFLTQDWMASLHYTHPVSGRSGQFQLPFTEEQCLIGGSTGALTCTAADGPTLTQDGIGPARSFASDSFMLTLTFRIDNEDIFPCTGCD